MSGGAWRTSADGSVCDHEALVAAMATFGARTRIPTLWLYAQNDSLFAPELVKRMRDDYAAAGGRAELRMFPPIAYDGHNLFADFGGRVKWLRALDRFLQTQQLPNANVARLERVMGATKLPAGARPVVEEYLSVPSPKVLALSASRCLLGRQSERHRGRPQAGADALPREIRRGVQRGDGEQRARSAHRHRCDHAADDDVLLAGSLRRRALRRAMGALLRAVPHASLVPLREARVGTALLCWVGRE